MIQNPVERGPAEQAPRLADFFDLVTLDVTDSTNRYARELAMDGAV